MAHFQDSAILARVTNDGTAADGRQALLAWLPGPHCTPQHKAWTLIYRGSRDGWLAHDFHAACDGKGPTLVLVLGAAKDGRDFVAGGYAAASWTSPRGTQLVPDPEFARVMGCGSFLFSLVDAEGHGPVQLRLKEPTNSRRAHRETSSLAHDPSYGPVFGGSVGDLAVGSSRLRKPLNAADNSWTATSFSRSVYDVTAADAQGCTTFRGPRNAHGRNKVYYFTTKELEVFALQPARASEPCSESA